MQLHGDAHGKLSQLDEQRIMKLKQTRRQKLLEQIKWLHDATNRFLGAAAAAAIFSLGLIESSNST